MSAGSLIIPSSPAFWRIDVVYSGCCVALSLRRDSACRLSLCQIFFFFFFSSRRRHTRCYRDWSSDVCTSDLFLRGDHRHRVVIGKDTRLSGYMMESAMVAGFTSVGMDVVLVGPMPTPAVAMLTRSMRADLGVMISASHNPFADNGIKLFGPDGYKLSDDDEREIEKRLEQPPALAKSELIGRARRIDDARGRYIHFVKATFPEQLRLDGLKVVIDCANGAAYHVAPEALWELGAEVIPLGVTPNGLNINEACGSTHPQVLQETVVASGADIGIALDGDADRLIVVDEKGQMVDGDQLMALIALGLHARGELRGEAVVAT